jgi:hypothetical protein
MNEFDKALRYIFVLSVILILVAYYAGTQRVATTFGTQLGNLINISTGRTTSGQFAAYPTGGPPPM